LLDPAVSMGSDAKGETMTLTGRRDFLKALGACAGVGAIPGSAVAFEERPIVYTNDQLVLSGHRFFGSVSKSLAEVVEMAGRRWGKPNGYILGEEAGGAFVGGLRYGEGVLYTRNSGDRRLFWQGPSLGFDAGGDGDRTMMLIYNLPERQAIFQRFGGLDGSAYFIGGLGMTTLVSDNVVVVPIRTGLGARLGVNVGYLKFTQDQTWNPF
jgi:hypothetical protein